MGSFEEGEMDGWMDGWTDRQVRGGGWDVGKWV